MTKNIHGIGTERPHKVLVELINMSDKIDGIIVGIRTKDGESAIVMANVDSQTATYLVSILGWAVYEHMDVKLEKQ